MTLTKNFNLTTDPKLGCTCGHPDCDLRVVIQEVLDKVQLIRNDYGKPMRITSGGRCPNHHDEVRKAKPGDHQKRVAVDVAYENTFDRTKLMVLAGRHGATRVAYGHGFIHLAWTETDDRSVPTWGY